MWRWRTPHWILTTYLAIYAMAIVGGLLVTHDLAGAVPHVLLMIVGAVVLDVLLPSMEGEQPTQRQ
jgi:hypothetical protein